MHKKPKAATKRPIVNQPDYREAAARRKLEGQLDKLTELIQAGYTREQTRSALGLSDAGLDQLIMILQGRATRPKPRKKPQTNRLLPKNLMAERTCKKCGTKYTRKQGGTKTLCGICDERQRQYDSTSVRAVPSAFESNRRKH
jgi:hypothetical protein